jgi:regulator of protease activity HflC (stomatin/prohibitin superfamily)
MFAVVMVAALLAFWLLLSVKVLKQYECGVIFRLGKVLPRPRGPGLIFVAWPIDRMVRVDLKEAGLTPAPEVILRDNVAAIVNLVVCFRPGEPSKSVGQRDN